MAEYKKSHFTGGPWAKGSELDGVKRAKILTEVHPEESQYTNKDGSVKMRDVAKVKFEGIDEPKNLTFNRQTINGLVEAFGSNSSDWVGKTLSVETEKVRVAGKSGVAIYLIPEGFERVDDDNGYAVIQRKGVKQPIAATAKYGKEEIPTINLDEDGREINVEEIPF